ncbi:uncharacterized protein EKO05_0009598 [Ascochyta rabiei]|uniref:uncharacterized protein n=1 Tax=Didymella rabiei TaxID=5454 RepID=UPI00220F5E7B|nr:uncharacterized protein EKO05_0009598 [Ascochyta rabiei]UPX19331.1 hypothetical protein EKO05_0009598 [Ascochyta rabiei]
METHVIPLTELLFEITLSQVALSRRHKETPTAAHAFKARFGELVASLRGRSVHHHVGCLDFAHSHS